MLRKAKASGSRRALLALFVPQLAVLVVALFSFATLVQADSITYVVSGIVSGAIGGSTFTNALVTVTATGDTANVVPASDSGLGNPNVTTTVEIPGIGTATVTDPTAIYSTVIAVSPDTGFPVLPYVVIGTVDNSPAPDNFTGIAAAGDNALLGYNLQTSIGPVTAALGGIGYPTELSVDTTLGNLSFSSDISPTAQGTFTATVTSTPEPSSLLFLASGMALLAGLGLSRFRARLLVARYRRAR